MAVAVTPPPLPFECTPLLNPTLPKPHYHATMSKQLTIVIPERPRSRVLQVQPPPPQQRGDEPSSSLADNVSSTAVAIDSCPDNGNEDNDSTRCASVSSYCTCDHLSPLSLHCEDCLRNGRDHAPRHPRQPRRRRERDWMATMEEGQLYTSFSPYLDERQRRSAWARCTENEGMLAFLEFMIVLQMRLLAMAVPTSLLFILLLVWYENNAELAVFGS
ncbi:uncharacterized protein PG986_005618 [Apiospora aurea]|uniref:Uncharacterized protein n=1 Tax=Apiospora aurea TaxID=335848 RepID=A0ABR1QJH7_9PEZI